MVCPTVPFSVRCRSENRRCTGLVRSIHSSWMNSMNRSTRLMNWLNRSPNRGSGRKRGPPPHRLSVEQLEERVVPSANVWTDRLDYSPGDMAVITGNGFQMGETVELQVLHIDGTANADADHQPWQVADGYRGPSYL